MSPTWDSRGRTEQPEGGKASQSTQSSDARSVVLLIRNQAGFMNTTAFDIATQQMVP